MTIVMRAEKAHGWAVISKDKIKVRTVSDTRRAAIVNWLVTERNILVRASWEDEDIERVWHENNRGDTQTICTVVTITEGA